MFDDIIKNPGKRMLKASWTIELKQDLKAKYRFEEDERRVKFTKDYEKWMEDYQKLKPDIYIKPVKPVEFIVLNFEITKTGVSFTDV